MHTLVSVFETSFEELKRIISKVEVLAKQPPLKVDKIYANRNPKLSYRRISVSNLSPDGIRYLVADMGTGEGIPSSVPFASRFYSEEEVEGLRAG